MTPTEVLNEVQKMSLIAKKELLEKLNREIQESDKDDLEMREKSYLENLRRKGLLNEIPNRISDDDIRENFKRIEINGEPLSETIIKERG